jgi:hypothetical protein
MQTPVQGACSRERAGAEKRGRHSVCHRAGPETLTVSVMREGNELETIARQATFYIYKIPFSSFAVLPISL